MTSWLLGFAGLAVTASIGLAGRRWTRTWLVLTTAGAGAGLIAALMVLMGAADWEWRGAVPFGGEFLHLRLDALSAVFLVAAWFGWVLRPEFSIRKPRGVLPVKAVRIGTIPETVLELLVRPAGDFITQLSVSARRLQHGGLQLYVLYVLGGLIAVGALVAAGGRP